MVSTRGPVHRALYAALEPRGYKHRGRLLVRPVAAGVDGVVSFNYATDDLPPGVTLINPIIGVRHDRIERAVTELTDVSRPDSQATIIRPLGYLMPQRTFLQWQFDDNASQVGPVDEVVDNIVEFGEPWIDRAQDLTGLMRELEAGHSPSWTSIKIPIVLHLMGRTTDANEWIAQHLRRVGTSDWGDAPYVRLMAERFETWTGGHPLRR